MTHRISQRTLLKYLSIVMLKVTTMPRGPLSIMTLIIIAFSIMTELCYAECHILFIFMLNIIMLCAVMLSVIMLRVFTLSIEIQSIIILSVIMLNVIMLSVVVLNVILLNAGAPSKVLPLPAWALFPEWFSIFVHILKSFITLGHY